MVTLIIATISRDLGRNWSVSHLHFYYFLRHTHSSHVSAASASDIHLAPLSRTTALNDVKAVKKNTSQLKSKQRGKAKPKVAENFDSGSNIGLSDEDDSQERKVALASPERGAEARKSGKVSCGILMD
jgi:hypothetical protein